MPYRICKVFEVESGHLLSKHPDVIEKLDHSICMNKQDPMYQTLQKAYGEHVIGFDHEDPTTEVVARTLFERIRENLNAYAQQPQTRYPLDQGVRLVRVRVWETPHGWGEYEA